MKIRKAKMWKFIAGVSGLIFLLAGCGSVNSTGNVVANYPTKPIEAVTYGAPGSPLDTYARTLSNLMQQNLKKPIDVQNLTGGSGAQVIQKIESSPADGYVIGDITDTFVQLLAEGNVSYPVSDFQLVARLNGEPSAILVRNDSQFHNLKDLVDYAKTNPGKLTFAGQGTGSFNNRVEQEFLKAAGITAQWVPYNGGNEAALALLGGTVDAMVQTPSSALSQIQDGKIRILAVSSENRSKFYPNVPTLKELGYNVNESIWRGVVVKNGTPEPVIQKLVASIEKAAQAQDWKTYLKKQHQEDLLLTDSQKLQDFMQQQFANDKQFSAKK